MPAFKNVVIDNLETQLKAQERLVAEAENELAKLQSEKEQFLNDMNQKIEQATQKLQRLTAEKQEIERAIQILMQQMPAIPSEEQIPPEGEAPQEA
jgi:Tfp pilus assembly protein PilO